MCTNLTSRTSVDKYIYIVLLISPEHLFIIIVWITKVAPILHVHANDKAEITSRVLRGIVYKTGKDKVGVQLTELPRCTL